MSAGLRELRDALGQFATGVTVVTTRYADAVHGTTVSSFASVSLDPPLVVVSLGRRSRMCTRLAGAPFGINVLGAQQRELALSFAGRAGAPVPARAWREHGAAPRLAGVVAHFACAPWAAYDGGDHILYVGEVSRFDHVGGEPLVFHGGAFRELRSTGASPAWTGSLDAPVAEAWVPAP